MASKVVFRGVIVLFVGGARSGKSSLAEKCARQLSQKNPPLAYVATTYLAPEGDPSFDADLASRIAVHRRRRGGEWLTVELFGDSLRPWMGAYEDSCNRDSSAASSDLPVSEGARASASSNAVITLADLAERLEGLEGTVLLDSFGSVVSALEFFDGDARGFAERISTYFSGSGPRNLVIVTDEVGLSVHPETMAGNRFRDALGAFNQVLAATADEVWQVSVGLPVRLSPSKLPSWAKD